MSNSVKFAIIGEEAPNIQLVSIPSIPRMGDPVILDEGLFEVVNVIWDFTSEEFRNQRRFTTIELRRLG